MLAPAERRMAIRKCRLTEEEIAHASRRAKMRSPVAEVCRAIGVGRPAIAGRRATAGRGARVSAGLKLLQEENRRRKPLVVDLSLGKPMLHDGISGRVAAVKVHASRAGGY